MSTSTIDERVVEMRFDNANFEKNVATSMSTLDKLKEKLKFSDASGGLSKLSTEASRVNLNPISNAVDNVGSKFDYFINTVAIGGMLRLGQQAVDTGERLIKSLSLDQVAAGWDKFQKKTTSSATLIAQGFDMSEVTEQLEKLNWFTDETSYNFTDMVDNIAKFTATGKGLSESVTAMEGIATWAALSGQNATKASQAMYQLSQAMSKGVLKYDDWKSISNASMDTAEFRRNAVDSAVALGTLKKAGKDTFETLEGKILTVNELFSSEHMSKQAWFTSDVMMETFDKYAIAVDQVSAAMDELYENNKIQILTSEVIKAYESLQKGEEEYNRYAKETLRLSDDQVIALRNTISGFDEFGIKAFGAAQKARTLTDAIEATKDAVSTGWMKTFELLIGNSEEATEVFSDLTEGLWEIFAAGTSARNELLAIWNEEGGREQLIEGLLNLWHSFVNIITAVRDAWKSVFPEMTAERLVEITEKFRKFTERIAVTGEKADKLRETLHNLFLPIGIGIQVIKIFITTIAKLLAIWINFIAQSGILKYALAGVLTVITVAVKLIVALGTALAKLFVKIKQSQVVQTVLTGIGTALTYIAGAIGLFIKGIGDLISGGTNAFEKFFTYVQEGFTKLYQSATKLPIIGGLLKALVTIIGGSIMVVKKAVGAIIDFFAVFLADPKQAIEELIQKFKELGQALVDWYDDSKLKEVVNTFKQVFTKIFGYVKEFVSNVISEISKMDLSSLLIATMGVGITYAIIELGKLFSTLSGVVSGVTGTLGAIKKAIKSFSKADTLTGKIFKIAEAIAILTACFVVLAHQDLGKVAIAASIMVGTVTLLGLAAVGLEKLASKFGNNSLKAVKTMGLAFLELGATLLVIASAFLIIKDIPFGQLMGSALSLILTLATLGTVAGLLGKYAPQLSKGGFVLIELAASVLILGKALETIATVPAERLKGSVEALIAMMASLAVLAFGMQKVKFSGALGVIALCLFVKYLGVTLDAIPFETIFANLDKIASLAMKIAGIVIVLQALKTIASFGGNGESRKLNGMSQFFISLLALSGALLILTKVFEQLNLMSIDVAGVLKILGFMIGASLLFVFIAETLGGQEFSTNVTKMATAVVLLTGAMWLVGLLAERLGEISIENLLKGVGAVTVLSLLFMGLLYCSKYVNGVKAGPIIAMLASVATIVVMMTLLSNLVMDPSRMVALIGAFGLIGLVIGALAALMKSSHFGQNAKTAPIIALVSAVGIIMISLITLTTLINGDYNKLFGLMATAGIISLVLLAFGETFRIVAKTAASKNFNLAALIAMIAGMAVICTALIALASMQVPGERLLLIGASIAGTLLAFAESAKLVSKSKIDLASMLALSAAMLVVATSLAIVATFGGDWSSALMAAVAISGVMIAMAAASKIAQGSVSGAAAMVILGASAALMAASLAILSSVDANGMLTAALALSGVALALSVTALLANGAIVGAAAMVILGVSAIAFAMSLAPLANYSIGSIMSAALGLSTVALTFSLIALIATGAIVGAAAMILLGISAITFAMALAPLAEYNIGGIMSAALGLTTVALTFSLIGLIATGAIVGAPAMIMLGISAIEFAMALRALSDIDIGAMIKASNGLVTVATSLTLVAYLATGAAIGAGALVTLGISLITLAAGMAILGEVNWSNLSKASSILPSLAAGVLALGINALAASPGLLALTASILAFIASTPMLAVAALSIEILVHAITYGLLKAVDSIEKFNLALKVFALQAATTIMSSATKVVTVFYKAGLLWGLSLEEGFRTGARWHSPPEWLTDMFGDIEDTLNTSDLPSIFEGFGDDLGLSLGNSFGESSIASMTEALSGTGDALGLGISDLEDLWNGFNLEDKEVNYGININENHNIYYNDAGHGTITDFVDQQTNELNRLGKEYDNLKSKQEYLNNAISLYANQSPSYLRKYEQQLKDVGKAIQLNIADQAQVKWELNRLDEKHAKTLEDVTEKTNELADAEAGLDEANKKLGGSTKELKTAYDDVREVVSNQLDIFSEFNKKTELTADKLLSNMRSQIQGVSEWATQMANLAAKGIDEGLLLKLQEMGPQGYEYVHAFATMTADQLAQANSLWGASLALPDLAASMLTGGSEIGTNIVTGLANGLQANELALASAMGLGQMTVEEVAAGAGCHSPSVITFETGMYIDEGLANGIQAFSGRVFQSAMFVAHELMNTFRQNLQPGQFTEVGRWICEGLAQGIRSYAGVAIGEANSLANSIRNTINNALKIASPSKVMIETGRFIDLGLAKGMRQYASAATSAASDLADATIVELQNTIASISNAINEEVDTQPVIRPVLDLSNLRSNAQSISGMLSTSNALKAAGSFSDAQNGSGLSSGMTFIQNNYSPEALSRIDIYRQTKNQFSAAKGLVNGI